MLMRRMLIATSQNQWLAQRAPRYRFVRKAVQRFMPGEDVSQALDAARALQEKRIAGAALDVYWDQPPFTQDPQVPEELCRLDNVILSPHNGGGTWDTRTRKAVSVAHGMVAMVRGERPAALRNPEIYSGT